MIQTVTGILEEEQVHNTLSHEHLVFGYPGIKNDPDNIFDMNKAYAHAMERIEMIRPYDVDLIVDPTPIECGRDPMFLKKVSEDSHIHIVCATGFFKDEDKELSVLKALSYSEDLKERLVKLYVKEIFQGIGNTPVKAGIIKTASSLNKITAMERSLFEAAVQAQKQTGVPIYTHCDRGTMAMEQCEILLKNDADIHKILIGHQTSNRDLKQIRKIMDLGFTVGFDQFGILSIPGIPNDEEKTENLLQLLKEGYEDHIVLSHDTIFDRMGYVSSSKPRYPDQIYKEILPYLRKQGISETAVRKLTRDNLLKLFAKKRIIRCVLCCFFDDEYSQDKPSFRS